MRLTPEQAIRLSALTVKKQISFNKLCSMVLEAGLRIIEEEKIMPTRRARQIRCSNVIRIFKRSERLMIENIDKKKTKKNNHARHRGRQ